MLHGLVRATLTGPDVTNANEALQVAAPTEALEFAGRVRPPRPPSLDGVLGVYQPLAARGLDVMRSSSQLATRPSARSNLPLLPSFVLPRPPALLLYLARRRARAHAHAHARLNAHVCA
jgi:hypothetical protein